jgi:hypothetical protein
MVRNATWAVGAAKSDTQNEVCASVDGELVSIWRIGNS